MIINLQAHSREYTSAVAGNKPQKPGGCFQDTGTQVVETATFALVRQCEALSNVAFRGPHGCV